MNKKDLKEIWSTKLETESSRFWLRNNYPEICRFLCFDVSDIYNELYTRELFQFWLTVLTLAKNKIPASNIQAYRLYKVYCDFDKAMMKETFTDIYSVICQAKETVESSLKVLPERTFQSDEEILQLQPVPVVFENHDEQSAYQIVNGIYHTVISRDIVKRHRINRQDLFDRVVKYVVENMGKTFSASAITKFLKSEHRTVSAESIYNYLRWLEQAFIIYPCHRYDIQGKSILKTQEKYYLADVTLKYCLLGYNRKMLDGALENIVFLEMKRRGYDVFIGKNASKEIDFIGVRRDEKLYVQVCVQLPENSDREIGNLMEIPDHYPKYVVTTNRMDVGIDNGIRIMHLADFLLSERW